PADIGNSPPEVSEAHPETPSVHITRRVRVVGRGDPHDVPGFTQRRRQREEGLHITTATSRRQENAHWPALYQRLSHRGSLWGTDPPSASSILRRMREDASVLQ